MVRGVASWDVVRSVASGKYCIVRDAEVRCGVVEPCFSEGNDVGCVSVEVVVKFFEFDWVVDGLNVGVENGDMLRSRR